MGFLYTINTSRASSWLSRSPCRLRAYAEQNVTRFGPPATLAPLHRLYCMCSLSYYILLLRIGTESSLLCGIGHGDGLNKENRLAKPTSVWWQFTDQALVLLVSTPPAPRPLNLINPFPQWWPASTSYWLFCFLPCAANLPAFLFLHSHVTASSSNYCDTLSSPHPTHQ